MFLHADSENSDQTVRMHRLIWVFTGHTGHFVGFVMWRLIWQFTVILQYELQHEAQQNTTSIISINMAQMYMYLRIIYSYIEDINCVRSLAENWTEGSVVLTRAQIGHWPDMVYPTPPQGEFCRPWFSWSLTFYKFVQHVSPLAIVALMSNSPLPIQKR